MQECSARRFFGSKERSIEAVRLWNHEAVPEETCQNMDGFCNYFTYMLLQFGPGLVDMSNVAFFPSLQSCSHTHSRTHASHVFEDTECRDWFRECTLFQINRHHCHGFRPPREYDSILRQREGREFEPEQPDAETCPLPCCILLPNGPNKEHGGSRIVVPSFLLVCFCELACVSNRAIKDNAWWDRIFGKVYLRRQEAAKRLKLNLPGSRPDRPCLDDLPSNAGMLEAFCGFSSYEGGKMIVRLNRHLPPPIPSNKHCWLADNGSMLQEIYQANKSDDAVILHYPNAGMQNWRQKYETKSGVSGMSGTGVPGVESLTWPSSRLPLASSTVLSGGSRRDQDLFYRTFILQNEHNELAYLAEHGLVTRVEIVRNILYYYDNPQAPPEQLPGQTTWVDPKSGLKLGRA